MKEVPENLILMQLVVNGAISILEHEKTPRDSIKTALYWLKSEIEDTLIPAQKMSE